MQENIEPWQAPIDNQNGNWNLRLNVKILLRFLRLFLIPLAYILFKKIVNRNRNLARQTAMHYESTNNSCSKTIESIVKGQEEKASEMETKETTDNNPCTKTLEMAIKRKTSAIQHKKETMEKPLTTMNLTNMETIIPKNDQEWQIIIDFHDISEFTQHHGMNLTGETDIFKWPSIAELKQQQKIKNSLSEERYGSLHTHIHYTDHIRLQKVNSYLQELLQILGDGCTLIETEHQIIIKILMVKDGISNDNGTRLNCKKANMSKKDLENVQNDCISNSKDDMEHYNKDELELANDTSLECYSRDDTKYPGKSYVECPSKDHAEYHGESHGEMTLFYYCCVCSLIFTLTFFHKLLYL